VSTESTTGVNGKHDRCQRKARQVSTESTTGVNGDDRCRQVTGVVTGVNGKHKLHCFNPKCNPRYLIGEPQHFKISQEVCIPVVSPTRESAIYTVFHREIQQELNAK
jgi:hypothetical protein